MINLLLAFCLSQAAMFAAPHSATIPPHHQGASANVRIRVFDGLGGIITNAQVKSFKNLESGVELASHFRLDRSQELGATSVPYGDYELKVSAAGFPEAERPVHVAATDVNVGICVRTATVHLVLDFDLPGTSTAFRVDSFVNRDGDFDLASHFQDKLGLKIPYGTYDLQVFHHLGYARRRVDLFQPEVWVILGIETYGESEALGPRTTFAGRIENIQPGDEPLFVRLVGTYFSYSLDAKVSVTGTSGTFQLVGDEPYGRYLLLTVSSKGILDIREFDPNQDTPIVVRLHGPENVRKAQH